MKKRIAAKLAAEKFTTITTAAAATTTCVDENIVNTDNNSFRQFSNCGICSGRTAATHVHHHHHHHIPGNKDIMDIVIELVPGNKGHVNKRRTGTSVMNYSDKKGVQLLSRQCGIYTLNKLQDSVMVDRNNYTLVDSHQLLRESTGYTSNNDSLVVVVEPNNRGGSVKKRNESSSRKKKRKDIIDSSFSSSSSSSSPPPTFLEKTKRKYTNTGSSLSTTGEVFRVPLPMDTTNSVIIDTSRKVTGIITMDNDGGGGVCSSFVETSTATNNNITTTDSPIMDSPERRQQLYTTLETFDITAVVNLLSSSTSITNDLRYFKLTAHDEIEYFRHFTLNKLCDTDIFIEKNGRLWMADVAKDGFTLHPTVIEEGRYRWFVGGTKISAKILYSNSCCTCVNARVNLGTAVFVNKENQMLGYSRHKFLIRVDKPYYPPPTDKKHDFSRIYSAAKTNDALLSAKNNNKNDSTVYGDRRRIVLGWHENFDETDWITDMDVVDVRHYKYTQDFYSRLPGNMAGSPIGKTTASANQVRQHILRASHILTTRPAELLRRNVRKTYALIDENIAAIVCNDNLVVCAYILYGDTDTVLTTDCDVIATPRALHFIPIHQRLENGCIKTCLQHVLDHVNKNINMNPDEMYRNTVSSPAETRASACRCGSGHRDWCNKSRVENLYAYINRDPDQSLVQTACDCDVDPIDLNRCVCKRKSETEQRLFSLVASSITNLNSERISVDTSLLPTMCFTDFDGSTITKPSHVHFTSHGCDLCTRTFLHPLGETHRREYAEFYLNHDATRLECPLDTTVPATLLNSIFNVKFNSFT